MAVAVGLVESCVCKSILGCASAVIEVSPFSKISSRSASFLPIVLRGGGRIWRLVRASIAVQLQSQQTEAREDDGFSGQCY